MYDYLLVVGPGRSGSDYLYRILRDHPDYAFPAIKEGAYYRSARAYRRASAPAKRTGKILCDISNDAYLDPGLLPGIRALQDEGVSVLLMVLLRNHRDRALSSIRFRRSRGRPSALFGARRLEAAVVRDRLSPEILEAIFSLDVDILTVDFSALVSNAETVLAKLASLCGTGPFETVATDPVNVSTRARFVWLSTLGWFCAVALRSLGLTRLLQRLKDSSSIGRVFFRPLAHDREEVHLSDDAERTLHDAHRKCWSVVTRRSVQEHEGIFIRPRRPRSTQ